MATGPLDAVAFKREQRQTWDHLSASWDHWHDLFETGAQPVSRRLLELARVGRGQIVLDVGTGTGEPALSAALITGPAGRVVGIDLSEEMIGAARRRSADVAQVDFLVADAEALDFKAGYFDAVVSRWGLMFLPDLEAALKAIGEMLRPGGRFAASVWAAPPMVPIISLAFGVIAARLSLPPPPPGLPGPFSLAQGDVLSQALVRAGLTDIAVEEIVLDFRVGSLDEFVAFARDLLPPFLKALLSERCGSVDDEATWEAVRAAALSYATVDGTLLMPCTAICWSARKPTDEKGPREPLGFDTKLVVVGSDPEEGVGGLVPPIHMAATYEQRAQTDLRYFYGRGENPTREGLEVCLASLEDAAFATAFASGQAAGASVLALVSPGQRVVASDDVYGGTYALLSTLAKYGIVVEYVDFSDPAVAPRVLADDVGLVWVETPTNPLLKIAEIRAVSDAARPYGVPVVVDNTFASPALQLPLALGADISLYSTTKSIAGHSDVIGGALVYNRDDIHEQVLAHRTALGAVPGAFDCFLVHRGLKTLSLRIDRQVATTRLIVNLLEASAAVGTVHFPGLPAHPHAHVAARQMRSPGAIVSFEYLGDPDVLLDRTRLFACAVSLGSVRSLIESPARMTHRPIPRDVLRRLGIGDNLIRLSIGIEHPDDLLADLDGALSAGCAGWVPPQVLSDHPDRSLA